MQSNVEFVTDGSVKYHLAGNDWYAVMRDDDKVMLVDTDCEVGGEELKTRWSDGDWKSESGKNAQCILNYCNNIADTYFSTIKHAIIPRTVETGTGKLENVWMWPMSYEEFKEHKDIGGKIVRNSNGNVWTRTFSGINYHFAWYLSNASGSLNSNNYVNDVYRVAPAFYLKKSEIDHINDNGEIFLKPEDNAN